MTAPLRFSAASVLCATAFLMQPAQALTGNQVGPSGKTYASAAVQCALHPSRGMAPLVQAGLYNPGRRSASATVAMNGVAIATVTRLSPDTSVWLSNGLDTVSVSINRGATDTYSFDATLDFPGQQNMCIPDTRLNTATPDIEYAQSLKSYATVTPGCALNPATGRTQPFVNLVDNGSYLLNVSVNNKPLTQLSASRPRTPVFLSAGLNVISAANGAVSTDYFVRDGGTGTCTLP
jgi:hypothetical protein